MVEIIRNPLIEQVYEGITQGFVDYYVDVTLTLEEFRERFFDFDKNELRYSAVALEGDEVVGAILGGVKQYGEETVFRCGALVIIPAHRKHGVGQLLLDDQEELVAELGATHILEVIQANEPALAFYKKMGSVCFEIFITSRVPSTVYHLNLNGSLPHQRILKNYSTVDRFGNTMRMRLKQGAPAIIDLKMKESTQSLPCTATRSLIS